MKQRADYLEMRRKMQELELSMTQGNPKYDKLVERYREMGKTDRKIDKTTFWSWILTDGRDFPEIFFYNTPPIEQASESKRILITGTKVETRDMYDIIKGSEAYQRVMKALSEKQRRLSQSSTQSPLQLPSQPQTFSDSKLIQTTTSSQNTNTTLEEIKPDYRFSASVGTFWDNFFGEEYFLDHPRKISIPCLIIGTGYMRNYNALGGETINVSKRLEEIAKGWDIPIQFIKSWAP